MGWDLYTYNSQPDFFLEQIAIFLNHEGMKDKDEVQKMELESSQNSTKISRYG